MEREKEKNDSLSAEEDLVSPKKSPRKTSQTTALKFSPCKTPRRSLTDTPQGSLHVEREPEVADMALVLKDQ
ncbi:unnamed protein product [Leptidea sinapis]|uniref:Uncharacterized protein n=1 Tax=Leptidea sinapis TaxID=189913 RepID=A0A5E4QRF0_9NEOP|nr:unnamed protein product [Leptidea sinapis]